VDGTIAGVSLKIVLWANNHGVLRECERKVGISWTTICLTEPSVHRAMQCNVANHAPDAIIWL